MSRTIAFISDLGYTDDAVAMCKGIMLQRSPRSQIIDITHSVTPFDAVEAAHYVADLPGYFPADTVFCCIIFPQTYVRPCIAARNERGQLFVAGDNGVLTLVERACAFEAVHEIDNPDVMILPPTPSFVGRDIMASCVGKLAAGFPLEEVGPALYEITRLKLASPRSAGDGTVLGNVSVIDKNFGNVWTDISERMCLEAGLSGSTELSVRFGDSGELCFPFVRTFGDVALGQPLAFINSRGRLAFALNQASLVQQIGVERSAEISVRPVQSAPTGAPLEDPVG